MAASSMIILPMIILYIVLQKYIIEGVARAELRVNSKNIKGVIVTK